MTAKSFLIGLLVVGTSIGAAHASHIGNEAHSPLAGVELGERLGKSVARSATAGGPQAEPATVDVDAPPARAERKVRIVYPLPR